MTTGFGGPFVELLKCLWTWVWLWRPQLQPRQKAKKATRGEPLLISMILYLQFAGGLSIVYYVVSQVKVNNHPE